MLEKRQVPAGQHLINMNGDIKAVANHLAFDRDLQKQMNFFPCDDNGIAVVQPEQAQTQPVKKNAVAAAKDEIRDYNEKDFLKKEEVEEPIVTIPADRTDVKGLNYNTTTTNDNLSGLEELEKQEQTNGSDTPAAGDEDCDKTNTAAAELNQPVAKEEQVKKAASAKAAKPAKEKKPKAEKAPKTPKAKIETTK